MVCACGRVQPEGTTIHYGMESAEQMLADSEFRKVVGLT